jgi:hypothetical protein
MGLLFLNEFINFNTYKTSSRMYVDVNRGLDKIKVNIDIDLNHIPCDILAILTSDALGEKTIDINGTITKSRLDKYGKKLDEKKYGIEEVNYDKVKTEMNNDEGCNLKGFFYVDAVPGSFQITSGYHGNIIVSLANERILKANIQHKINQISFGEFNKNEIWSSFGKDISKLSASLSDIKRKNDVNSRIYQYYLKVVPTKFLTYSGKEINNYQYTYSSFAEFTLNDMPSLYFRYDLSPITVEYKQYRETFLNFFINICAILGGVFTVTGIIDAIIHKSVVLLLRKAEMNKIA